MAVLTVTASRIAPIFPQKAQIFSFQATSAITAGQAVKFDATGKVSALSAASAGKCAGIALSTVGAGQAVSVLKSGHCAGIDPAANNAGASVYVGDTAGTVTDAAGTATILAGSVVAIATAGAIDKVVYVDCVWN